jgi:hypothetical protein
MKTWKKSKSAGCIDVFLVFWRCNIFGLLATRDGFFFLRGEANGLAADWPRIL